MRHYMVFQRSAQDRKVLKDSGYPWATLLFSPLWAFSKGLTLHGVVLAVLYGCCAVLMGVVTNGIVVGVFAQTIISGSVCIVSGFMVIMAVPSAPQCISEVSSATTTN